MAKEIDRRDPATNLTTPARTDSLLARAHEVSESLSGEHVLSIAAFDAPTGNPSVIVSAGAPAEKGNYVQRALNHVQEISTVIGLEETQAPEYLADPSVQFSSSGGATVHLQQQYKGIRIFQTAQGVRFNPDGSIGKTVGQSVTVQQDLPVDPKLTVQDAVLKAAQFLAEGPHIEEDVDEFGEPIPAKTISVDGFVPKIIATFPNQPEQATVLEAGPFADEIRANLTWFPLSDGPHLAWEMVFIMPDQGGQYRILVDASDSEVLYCRQLMSTIVAEGHVFVVDGANGREAVRFPRPLTDYNVPIPEGLPDDFPDHWVHEDSARGNAVNAMLFSTGQTLAGSEQNGMLVFNPQDPNGPEQQVLNIFYLNCFIHDFLYLYGFRESDGNFQQDNFGRGGTIADPVTAFAHDGPVNGTANMSTRVDGVSPIMNMGLVASTQRHTAFDSSVVFHEFMHGVTNRLVGGPMNTQALEDFQSSGMGEGWGDYLACTINKTEVVGSWVTGRAGGIRMHPYNSDFPDHFGMLGTGRFNKPQLNRQHAVGEIWCATLLEMNRRTRAHLGMQLVIDALKLSPVRPSFLDMRDAIFEALEQKLLAGLITADEHTSTRASIWEAFAKFGMGPNARSNGASLTGIVADFEVPEEVEPEEDEDEGSSLAGDVSATETHEAFSDVLAAIQIHGQELVMNPNVVLVRPGYRYKEANFVPEPVLSVTVVRKLDPSAIPPQHVIPAKLGKVAVDVIPATPLEQFAFLKRQDELSMAGSQTPAGVISRLVPGEIPPAPVAESAAMLEVAAEVIQYVAPDRPLAAVEEEMEVLCHASPDAGWSNLSKFIAGTQTRLTSTMFEFNARHILDGLTTSLQLPREFNLIMDGGAAGEVPGPAQTTVSKLDAREALRTSLEDRFSTVWAPVTDDHMTTKSIFPSAYHTKVSVRDGEAFWISSGNWKESGQPAIDPINGPLPDEFDPLKFQDDHNREWHVIVHNRELAETFETYITHDITQATPLQKPEAEPLAAGELPDLFIPAGGLSFGALEEPEFFREERFIGTFKVQPLMTPDNFPEKMLPLIRRARHSLYFQNQSLKPRQGHERYMPLFRALRNKSKRSEAHPDELDVKILVSEFTDLGLLEQHGFGMTRIRRQPQNHNKGIIIDDKIVVIGSHNWTGQGATENRDASLIFFDAPEIAAYFKKLFMYDWNRVEVTDSLMLAMPIVALPNEPTPEGMIKVPWTAVFPNWREAAAAD